MTEGRLESLLVALARDLTPEHRAHVAGAVRGLGGPRDPGADAVAAAIPQAAFGARWREILAAWRAEAAKVDGAGLALALSAAARGVDETKERLRVSAVWTGPATADFKPRRTAQVLEELARGAERELWVVTFAVHGADKVFESLRAAAERGVGVRLVLESRKESGGRLDYDRIRHIRSLLPPATPIYVWPADRRPDGKGLLHMKCAVADARLAFVTSANLTDHALEENMELGLLVQGRIAQSLTTHLHSLTRTDLLRRVE